MLRTEVVRYAAEHTVVIFCVYYGDFVTFLGDKGYFAIRFRSRVNREMGFIC